MLWTQWRCVLLFLCPSPHHWSIGVIGNFNCFWNSFASFQFHWRLGFHSRPIPFHHYCQLLAFFFSKSCLLAICSFTHFTTIVNFSKLFVKLILVWPIKDFSVLSLHMSVIVTEMKARLSNYCRGLMACDIILRLRVIPVTPRKVVVLHKKLL